MVKKGGDKECKPRNGKEEENFKKERSFNNAKFCKEKEASESSDEFEIEVLSNMVKYKASMNNEKWKPSYWDKNLGYKKMEALRYTLPRNWMWREGEKLRNMLWQKQGYRNTFKRMGLFVK